MNSTDYEYFSQEQHPFQHSNKSCFYFYELCNAGTTSDVYAHLSCSALLLILTLSA